MAMRYDQSVKKDVQTMKPVSKATVDFKTECLSMGHIWKGADQNSTPIKQQSLMYTPENPGTLVDRTGATCTVPKDIIDAAEAVKITISEEVKYSFKSALNILRKLF